MTDEKNTEQINEYFKALSRLCGINVQVADPAKLYDICKVRQSSCTKEQCQSTAQSAVYYAEELKHSCLYLCPAGFCRMLSATERGKNRIFSDPFLTSAGENQTKFPLLRLSPEKIYALSVLQSALTGRCENQMHLQIKAELMQAVTKRNAPEIARVCTQTTEKIASDCHSDFFKARFALCHFALMLYEAMDDEKNDSSHLDLLLRAESYEDAKQIIKTMIEHLIHTVHKKSAVGQNIAIEEAVLYVQKNYASKFSQEEVAKAVYLSPSYFSHLFQKVKGVRFIDFVNQVRIARAQELLENPAVKPETVYVRVGYGSRSYFTKIFQKITGISPSRYRKQRIK